MRIVLSAVLATSFATLVACSGTDETTTGSVEADPVDPGATVVVPAEPEAPADPLAPAPTQ